MKTIKANAKNIQADLWYLTWAGYKVARGPFAKEYDAKVASYQTQWPARANCPSMFIVMRGADIIAKKLEFADWYKELTPRQTVNATVRAEKERIVVRERKERVAKMDKQRLSRQSKKAA